MAVTVSEGFEGLSDGTAITDVNTAYDNVSGGGTVEADTADPIVESVSALTTVTDTQTVLLRHDIGSLVSQRWWRWSYRPESLPAGNQIIGNLQSGSTTRAEVRQDSSGTLTIRNGFLAVATTTLSLAAGDEARLQWSVDASGGTNELQVFVGANINGTTPDETISDAGYAEGTYDTFFHGIVTSGSAWSATVDSYEGDDAAYPGPAVTPDVTARIHEARFVLPQAATATARIHGARLVLPASSAGSNRDGAVWMVAGGTLHPWRVYKARNGELVAF